MRGVSNLYVTTRDFYRALELPEDQRIYAYKRTSRQRYSKEIAALNLQEAYRLLWPKDVAWTLKGLSTYNEQTDRVSSIKAGPTKLTLRVGGKLPGQQDQDAADQDGDQDDNQDSDQGSSGGSERSTTQQPADLDESQRSEDGGAASQTTS